MGICSCTSIVSRENMFLSSFDRYYCLARPVLGAGEFRMSFLPSTNRANTIFKTTVFLSDVIFEQIVLLLWLKKVLKLLKKFALCKDLFSMDLKFILAWRKFIIS